MNIPSQTQDDTRILQQLLSVLQFHLIPFQIGNANGLRFYSEYGTPINSNDFSNGFS